LRTSSSQKWGFGEEGEEDMVSLEESFTLSSKPRHANAVMGHRIPQFHAFSVRRQIAKAAIMAITRAVVPA
jgi:hypothetical protein